MTNVRLVSDRLTNLTAFLHERARLGEPVTPEECETIARQLMPITADVNAYENFLIQCTRAFVDATSDLEIGTDALARVVRSDNVVDLPPKNGGAS